MHSGVRTHWALHECQVCDTRIHACPLGHPSVCKRPCVCVGLGVCEGPRVSVTGAHTHGGRGALSGRGGSWCRVSAAMSVCLSTPLPNSSTPHRALPCYPGFWKQVPAPRAWECGIPEPLQGSGGMFQIRMKVPAVEWGRSCCWCQPALPTGCQVGRRRCCWC